jgi:RNA polymerase sigma-70 factor (ECF subfamily)
MSTFQEVFETTRPRLHAYLLRVSRNPDTVGDVIQECARRCLEHYVHAEITPSLLFTIARNAFMDHLRRTARLASLEEGECDPRPDPEQQALVQDRFSRVLAGLRALGREERDILAMVACSELSYAQIAQIMGTTESNIKVKVHRARVKLRRQLEDGRHG